MVNSEFRPTGEPLLSQALLKADKITLTVERLDDGKLRATCGAWDDAKIFGPHEAVVLRNVDRQVHIYRQPEDVMPTPKAPDLGEDDFEGDDAGDLSAV